VDLQRFVKRYAHTRAEHELRVGRGHVVRQCAVHAVAVMPAEHVRDCELRGQHRAPLPACDRQLILARDAAAALRARALDRPSQQREQQRARAGDGR
jgi:hypothetical protein